MDRPSSARPATAFPLPRSLWSKDTARTLSDSELLRYRSNLLGADLAVTNFGGGNTSAKIATPDPLSGAPTHGPLGQGFGRRSRQHGARRLRHTLPSTSSWRSSRAIAAATRKTRWSPICRIALSTLNPRAASIDTPLHAFLPFAHVDHVHPDALIALAASSNGEAVTRGDLRRRASAGLSWQRPGFDLALRIRDLVEAHPDLRGIVLAGHGIICWADTSRACYDNTHRPHCARGAPSERALRRSSRLRRRSAAAAAAGASASANRRRTVAALACAGDRRGAQDRSLQRRAGNAGIRLLGGCGPARRTSALRVPDHFLRTKIQPLLLDPARARGRRRCLSGKRVRGLPRRTTPPTTRAAARRIRLPCAMPIRS